MHSYDIAKLPAPDTRLARGTGRTTRALKRAINHHARSGKKVCYICANDKHALTVEAQARDIAKALGCEWVLDSGNLTIRSVYGSGLMVRNTLPRSIPADVTLYDHYTLECGWQEVIDAWLDATS